jgi:hypothetical protein
VRPHRSFRKAGHLPPFIPIFKDTIKTEAWKALSHGARSLYAVLKGRYNNKLQNFVFGAEIAMAQAPRSPLKQSAPFWFDLA